MGRIKESIPNSAAIRSGVLGEVLVKHTRERVHVFFLFAYFANILKDRIESLTGQTVSYTDMLQVKATHQIGTGTRRSTPTIDPFDETDPNVVNMWATEFRKLDAAHFCNLGIKTPFRNQVASLAISQNDVLLPKWLKNLESTAKDTRQLPQRINIGPDRIVDILHGDLIFQYLTDGTPIISPDHFVNYSNQGLTRLQAYRGRLANENKHGLAACVDCYISVIGSLPEINEKYEDLKDGLRFECEAYNLDTARYIL